MTSGKGAVLVMGAGDFTGAAVARRFAREGYFAALCRRPRNEDKMADAIARIRAEGGQARAYGCDARDEAQVAATVAAAERDGGPIEVFVHNIGTNVRFPVLETTPQVFRKVWELAAYSAFLSARAVAARMIARGRGTMIFTGATASVRGGSGFAAFAAGMHAKRALAQSLARELGPQNIHVAHVVVDGIIDTDFIRTQRPDLAAERAARDGLLAPDAIAETYWSLHAQPRTAWSWEVDLRPWNEPW